MFVKFHKTIKRLHKLSDKLVISMPKKLEKSGYDFSLNFDKHEAFDCLIQAE